MPRRPRTRVARRGSPPATTCRGTVRGLVAAPTFDLQSHSTSSGGTLPPAAVVARAARAGVELLALTDHDTVDGVAEALAAAVGLRVVPATELSSIDGD